MDTRFEFYPKIILSNTSAKITIIPLTNDVLFDDSKDYIIRYYPYQRSNNESCTNVKSKNGVITFEQLFIGEQEHKIDLISIQDEMTYHFNFYSVEEDLFYKNPYKGDLHMHTNRSDGLEDPEDVTALCRKIGLDFMAITDHHIYNPSIEAQEFFKDTPIDMLIARGEEVHAESNSIHIINFGGDFSINEFIRANPDLYRREVREIEKTIKNIHGSQGKYDIASSLWVFNKIKAANGLSIFCHPYWLYLSRILCF